MDCTDSKHDQHSSPDQNGSSDGRLLGHGARKQTLNLQVRNAYSREPGVGRYEPRSETSRGLGRWEQMKMTKSQMTGSEMVAADFQLACERPALRLAEDNEPGWFVKVNLFGQIVSVWATEV